MSTPASILTAALDSLPAILALVQSNHATSNPGVPPPTDADVIAGLHSAVASVAAKGDAWKAAHPPAGDSGGATGV